MHDKSIQVLNIQVYATPPKDASHIMDARFSRILQAINSENGHSDTMPDGPCSPDSVMLYTYTGGTTKHSKCVVVTRSGDEISLRFLICQS